MAHEDYRAALLTRTPIGFNQELVRCEHTGRTALLNSRDVQWLGMCSRFKPLDVHANDLHSAGMSAGTPADAARLRELADGGWLLPLRAFLTGANVGPQAQSQAAIEWVAVPTLGRPASLARALASYAGNARANGRHVRFLVVDGSTTRDDERDCRAALEHSRSATGTATFYAGPRQKSAFADLLADRVGVPRRVVEFAVTGAGWNAPAIGANRNAILLQTAGQMFFSVDDDTVCSPVVIGDGYQSGDGLALIGDREPTEFWFFPDRAAAVAGARHVDVDVLAEHEAVLGRRVSDVVARACAGGAPVSLADACPHLLDSLLRGAGTVVASVNGLVGDSAMYAGANLGMLEGPTRDRLLRSVEAYEQGMTSREVIRQVTVPTIAHGGQFISTYVGLDNRELLPPFMPAYRNEDGAFGAVLSFCAPNGYVGHRPWALVHDPSGHRSYSQDAWSKIRVADMVNALVASAGSCHGHEGAGFRMQRLGTYLAEVASLDVTEFAELLAHALRRSVHEFVARCEHVVDRHVQAPAYWAADVRTKARRVVEASTGADYVLALELRECGDNDAVLTKMQRFLADYAELLRCWPSLIAGTRELARHGHELAEELRS